MPDKTFELVLPFYEYMTPTGYRTFPILQVGLLSPDGTQTDLPMLVDTGSDVTVLRRDLYPLLGLPDWNVGVEVPLTRAGDENEVAEAMYEYPNITLVICGQAVQCTVALAALANEGFYQGLLGRQDIFPRFGFGFWESTQELLVTVNP